jgi:hypothetical protein
MGGRFVSDQFNGHKSLPSLRFSALLGEISQSRFLSKPRQQQQCQQHNPRFSGLSGWAERLTLTTLKGRPYQTSPDMQARPRVDIFGHQADKISHVWFRSRSGAMRLCAVRMAFTPRDLNRFVVRPPAPRCATNTDAGFLRRQPCREIVDRAKGIVLAGDNRGVRAAQIENRKTRPPLA